MSLSKSRRRRPQKKKSHKKLVLIVSFFVVIGLIVGVVAFIGGRIDSDAVKVRLETSMGDIVIELREDTPITSGNFEYLVQQGLYHGTVFHRVVDGFVIQGGQVNSSVPTIPSEVIGGNNKNDRGTVAMALVGNPPNKDSATSQFFINLVDNNELDPNFTVFGRVVEGMDVVDEIGKVETHGEPFNRPLEDVTVITATIVE